MADYSKYRAVSIEGVKVVGKIELKPAPVKIKDRKKKTFNNEARCCYCRKDIVGAKTVEHIIPLSLGGNNKIENKAFCCRRCNSMRANLTLSEFEKVIAEKVKPRQPERAKIMIVNINRLREYIRNMNVRLLKSNVGQDRSWQTIDMMCN